MFAGAAVTWAVRAQVLPSLSSSESELYGLSTSVCDLLSVLYVLEEMYSSFEGAVTIYTDSRGARLLAMDSSAAARTRHIHRRWYFVQHYIEEGRLRVKQIKGSENHANFLTKPVGGKAYACDRDFSVGATSRATRL